MECVVDIEDVIKLISLSHVCVNYSRTSHIVLYNSFDVFLAVIVVPARVLMQLVMSYLVKKWGCADGKDELSVCLLHHSLPFSAVLRAPVIVSVDFFANSPSKNSAHVLLPLYPNHIS
jgi:hypothetical protein